MEKRSDVCLAVEQITDWIKSKKSLKIMLQINLIYRIASTNI